MLGGYGRGVCSYGAVVEVVIQGTDSLRSTIAISAKRLGEPGLCSALNLTDLAGKLHIDLRMVGQPEWGRARSPAGQLVRWRESGVVKRAKNAVVRRRRSSFLLFWAPDRWFAGSWGMKI